MAVQQLPLWGEAGLIKDFELTISSDTIPFNIIFIINLISSGTLPSWCGSLSCLLLGLLLFPINQGKVEVNVEPLKYVWYYQCWSLHFSGLTENKLERCLALSVVCFEVYCNPDDGAWTKIGFTPFWGKCLSFSCSRSTPLKIDQRG